MSRSYGYGIKFGSPPGRVAAAGPSAALNCEPRGASIGALRRRPGTEGGREWLGELA